ncbi:MAG: FAD-dependent thymidylate synthase [Parcubacteria group bacterium]|jgi:thymidylate synthase (FAD)
MLCPTDTWIKGLACAVAVRHPVFFPEVNFGGDNKMEQLIEKVDLATLDGVIKDENPDLWRRHRFVAVKFIVNRAVTHELVRHRPCSFLQESQRYCNYGLDRFDKRVTFIKPLFFPEDSEEYQDWLEAVEFTAKKYFKLLKTSTPQAARTVFANSCKTEIIVFTNIEQWNHILHLRTSSAAEPSMREVMIPLQKAMQEMFPRDSFDKRIPEAYAQFPWEWDAFCLEYP